MKALTAELRSRLQAAILKARHEAEFTCRSSLRSLGVEDETLLRIWMSLTRSCGLVYARSCASLAWNFDLLVSRVRLRAVAPASLRPFPRGERPPPPPRLQGPGDACRVRGARLRARRARRLGGGRPLRGRDPAGIFRLDDPCMRLRLAPEGRLALEAILEALPRGDLHMPMMASAGSTSSGRRRRRTRSTPPSARSAAPTSARSRSSSPRTTWSASCSRTRSAHGGRLVIPRARCSEECEYLRFDDDGKPAAGSFDGWPERVAEVTVMDPCCGSGHFLVEAFADALAHARRGGGARPGRRPRRRPSQTTSSASSSIRAASRSRCSRVALTAWKAGGGWRELPVPHIACSGIPAKAPVEEWKALAKGDQRLEQALEPAPHPLQGRRHPRQPDRSESGRPRSRAGEGPAFVRGRRLGGDRAAAREGAASDEAEDPATAVLGADAAGIARAADYLSRRYTLVATNVPYLARQSSRSSSLRATATSAIPIGQSDLATVFLERARGCCSSGGSLQP